MLSLTIVTNCLKNPMNRSTSTAVAILLGAAAAATAATPSRDEARLIGAWQEGLPQRLAQGTPAQPGAITVFKADHSFELHPPCGPKQEDLRRVGLQSVPGTWHLSDAGELTVTIGIGQRKIVTQGRLQWKAGQMAWVGKDGRLLQRAAGKYAGPLPPAC